MTENEAIKLLKKANRNNDMVCIFPKSDIGKCLIKALEEIQLYHAIGTVEECREAAEKQNREPVKNLYDTRYIWKSGYCPVCGCGVTSRWDYCQCCGQKLNWRIWNE